jgi:hypothetical protein
MPDLLNTIQRCFIDPLTPAQFEALTDSLRTLHDELRPAAAVHTPDPPMPTPSGSAPSHRWHQWEERPAWQLPEL